MHHHSQPAPLLLMVATLTLGGAAAVAATPEPASWRGEVWLDAPFRVAEGTFLRVEPGTVVAGPGWLEVEGTLLARGTADRPIVWRTNLTVSGAATLEHVHVEGRSSHRPCAVEVAGGTLEAQRSLFHNTTMALCLTQGAYAAVETSTFAFNGFALHAARPVRPAVCSDGDCEPATVAAEGAPGTDGGCWALPEGGWSCRGWGGAPALTIDDGSTARIERSRFHANHVGVQSSSGGVEVVDNDFEDNDAGLVVGMGPGVAPQGAVLVRGNAFRAHGDPAAPPSPSPGALAGARVALGFGPGVQPDPDQVGVRFEDNLFEDNVVGLQVEGWNPTVRAERNDFAGNAIGFRSLTASAQLVDNRFASRVWDVYADGTSGYVTVHGGTLDRAKVFVRGEQRVETDWGILAGTGAISVGAILALVTEPGRYALARFVVPLYSHRRGEALLTHATREAILRLSRANPGIHLRALGRDAGSSYGATLYHVARLEREGLVRTRRAGLRRCVFPPGTTAVVDLGPQERVYEHVRANPGVTQAELARHLGMSKQLASHHVRSLEARGRLRTASSVRGKALYAEPPAAGTDERADPTGSPVR